MVPFKDLGLVKDLSQSSQPPSLLMLLLLLPIPRFKLPM